MLTAALASWEFDPWVVLPLLALAWIYCRGWQQLHRQMPSQFGPWRLTAFLAGLGFLLVAIASPLDAFAGLLLQVHMTQHLILMMIAPPLLWLGAPATPLLRGLPTALAKPGIGPFLSSPRLQRLSILLGHPALCWLSFVIMTWAWHVPFLYELALRSVFWHRVEHVCFLVTALLFWWPVIQPWPSRSVWPRWTMIPYLLLADVQNTVFSALFTFADRVLYGVYQEVPRLWGTTALEDQVAAGVIMWIPGSIAFLLPVAWLVTEMLTAPAIRPGAPVDPSGVTKKTTARLPVYGPGAVSRRSSRRRWDLLELPLVGSLFGSRYFRPAMQSLMFLLAFAVILDGTLGPQISPLNLAGVLPWTYWRGFVVIALFVGGNFFCMVCPFLLPRELARRLRPPRLAWPSRLRSKWIAVTLLALYLVGYEALNLWNNPWWTAWIVVAYFGAAFLTDGLFRGASFCKYVCPIGQFHFVQSAVSPLQVAVRESAACRSCTTHDCVRGNEQRRGCELELFQPEKRGNFDCTFCLDCVHACPHDNVGILAAVPATDLIDDPYRSSLGRLSQRTDVAGLALLLTFGAFVNAAGMVHPVMRWHAALAEDWGLDSSTPLLVALLLMTLLVLPPLLVCGCGWLGRNWSRVGVSWRDITRRLVLALVPLGFSMWVAHFLMHLVMGAGSIVPVAGRVAADLGIGIAAAASADALAPMPSAGWLLSTEVLLLDAGLLLSLYIGWRIAGSLAPRALRALRLWLPWASLAALLYAFGVWVFLQPMHMRGMTM